MLPWLDGPLAISEPHLRRLVQDVRGLSAADLEAAAAARPPGRAAAKASTVAVVPITGLIAPRETAWGWLFGEIGLDAIVAELRGLVADAGVQAIVLDIDSPGGSVYGVEEAASAVRALRTQKPIVAVANPLAASAAYWLLSAATEALVTPSGEVGSVGVYSLHLDFSRSLDAAGITPTLISAGPHKVEGNPYQPLGDEARDSLQASVDRYYGMFVAAVAKGRDVSVEDVRETFGGGRVLGAKAAQAARMVDGVGTVEDGIARAVALARGRAQDAARAAADVAWLETARLRLSAEGLR